MGEYTSIGGDFDGDGTDEWVVTAREGDLDPLTLGTESHAYVFDGDLVGAATPDDALIQWIGDGPDVYAAIGADLQGDGAADLAVLGQSGNTWWTADPGSGVHLATDAVLFEFDLSSNGDLDAGDLDADGFPDLVIGSAEANVFGRVWVVWGAP